MGETAEGSILGAIDTMRTLGIEHEVVDSSEELCRRYEGLRLEDGDIGVFTVGDGSINATAACLGMAEYAMPHGVTLQEEATVLRFYTEGVGHTNALLLLNDFSVIRVKRKLVMTTGGWTTRIVKEDFDIDMNADVQMVAWGHFELFDDEANMPQWFCFCDGSHTNIPMSESQHGLYYGFPAIPSHGKSRTSRIVKGTDFTPECAYMGSIVPK
ncbi:Monomeric sarcosine oxidase [Gracilariopsis chorda]|uniref:Monomeric sarcosine oxidase n=1 Tax=Gracilariopsis chorda TaxID=448386 RepID=A0A2V3IIF7_9FLOR|nr:Monomeric sarcosine oxidase [Gracilariopsis chorda]|eukprot:PXF41874.1 Monomeric sarcosine oxidase [Gracilariopsis chorda]